ncbi:MAG: type IV secretion system DNA-binding domain-containing protein [Candidatus Saccharibacteria bacterium]|nr:type IV secretion system DNA-binding domain-containing protein [Candidatus Saccharibacteria bacterium]
MGNILHFLLMPIVWIPIVAILAFLTYRNYKKINRLKVLNVDSVLLRLEIPRTNDKKELAAEQMFASLHGILRDARDLRANGGVQEHLSFEIASHGGQIQFYVWVPKELQNFVEGQIYAQYPTVQIHVCDSDYVDNRKNHTVTLATELGLTMPEPLPIKTFTDFEVDPLAGITGTLAKLDPDHSEELWIQILTRPVADSWHQDSDKWIARIKSGKKSINLFGIDWTWLITSIGALWTPPTGGTTSEVKVELSERAKSQVSAAEEKATKLGYQVKIRLAYLGDDSINAKLNMQALVGTFKQYNSTSLNGFQQIASSTDPKGLDSYKARQFSDSGFILNISELASVYHLPHTSVETPNIVWATSKTAEPPAKLPLITGTSNDMNISAFGLTNFRGINHQFGMLRRDRSRHVYIIGQTGAGKSGLLELFALSDTFYNQGYCIIDPHGDFAIDNLRFVPKSRIEDVVYFNPADTQYPVAFNPLELSDATRKPNVCSEVIGVLKRMFGDSWGPRLEHILRYTLLALLDRPETTLLDISRMLTDKDFRKETLDYCTDVTVLQFWKHEFGQWNEKQVNESIAPVLNKVGAFTANPIIRNIIGQPHSSFNVRKIMDEGKILVVNLSKGLIGEDNAGILGAFLVTKIQLAAMSRSDIPNVEDRRPFYLYVDEFQNFATDSFAVILSEARKYGLNLTVANQYIAQMTDQVRDAVFGNVGTTISFRVSADDAPILSKQFEPTFEAADLLQMNNRNFVISMIIAGEKVPAFSATSLNIPETPEDNFEAIVASSRAKYSRNRADVENEIRETIEQSEKYKKELSDSGREAGEAGNDPFANSSWGSNYGSRSNNPAVTGPKPTFIVAQTKKSAPSPAPKAPTSAPEAPEAPSEPEEPSISTPAEEAPEEVLRVSHAKSTPVTTEVASSPAPTPVATPVTEPQGITISSKKDFRKISPNTVEGKSSGKTLKDLGSLVDKSQLANSSENSSDKKSKRGKRRYKKYRGKKNKEV